MSRGDIVLLDLGTPIGHEAGYERPALVVSDDRMLDVGLLTVCPITSTAQGWPSHLEIEPGRSGLDRVSYVQTEQVRTVSSARVKRTVGSVDIVVLHAVEQRLRFLFGL